MRIYVNPSCNMFYYSFYFEGLAQHFGRSNIHYTANGFPDLPQEFPKNYMAVRMDNQRIIIDGMDSDDWDQNGLDWATCYAKINISPERIPPGYEDKIVSIPPSFGLRYMSPLRSVIQYVRSILAEPKTLRNKQELRTRLANYTRQFRYRNVSSAYVPAETDDHYLFFISSIWKLEVDTANRYRLNFIKAARSFADLEVEAGFAPRSRGDVPGYEDYTFSQSYPYDAYFEKMRRSIIAFNTPACFLCHGWKLAEYMAFGKAVISTPLLRLLPAPLENGKHIHIIDGSQDSITEAISYMVDHPDYRQQLENNIRQYWETYGTPYKVIELILSGTRLHQQVQLT